MYLHLLIKLGKSSYLPEFRSQGSFRMGTFESYRNSENREIGDPNEGAHQIRYHNDLLVSKLNDETNTYEEIARLSNAVSRHFNDIYEQSRIFCMYYATVKAKDEVRLSDIIDIKLLEDFEYDHIVVVFNLKSFYERLDSYFDKQNRPYRRGYVNYVDLSKGADNLTPFEKDKKYVHQSEFRLCIQGISGSEYHDVSVGSISDISFECSINELDTIKICRQ